MGDAPASSGPKFRIVAGRSLGESRSSGGFQQHHPGAPGPVGTPLSHPVPTHAPPSQHQMQIQGPIAPPPHSMQGEPVQRIPHPQMMQPPMQQMAPGVPSPKQQVQMGQSSQRGGPPQTASGPGGTQMQPGPGNTGPPEQTTPPQDDDEQLVVTKCVRFFNTLITISHQPDHSIEAAELVKELVTLVINASISIDEFTIRLQGALKSQAQPHLLPFLAKTLPMLRRDIINGDAHIERITLTTGGMAPHGAPPTGEVAPPYPQSRPQHPGPGPSPLSGHAPSPMPPGTPQQPPTPQQVYSQHQGPGSQGPPPGMPVGMRVPMQNNRPAPVQAHERMDTDEKPMSLIGQSPMGPSPVRIQAPPGTMGPLPGHGGPSLHGQPAPASQQHVTALPEEEPLQTRQFTETPFRFALLRPEQIMAKITQRMNVACYVDEDLLTLISDAAEYRMRHIISEIGVVAQHRIDPNPKMNPDYVQIDDTKAQLKWLENLDREQEDLRETREKDEIIRLSKSKGLASVAKDTLERAKEMQRADAEAKRNRDANAAAIAALGGTKSKSKWDSAASGGAGGPAHVFRPRTVRVNLRDLYSVMSTDPRCRRSAILHKLALSAPTTDSTI